MYELNYFTVPCETTAVTAAAVKPCGGRGGLVDGIISELGCRFDPYTLSGRSYSCNGLN